MGGADSLFAGGLPDDADFEPPFAIASMISAFFKPVTFRSSDLAISLSSVTAFVSRTERSNVANYSFPFIIFFPPCPLTLLA